MAGINKLTYTSVTFPRLAILSTLYSTHPKYRTADAYSKSGLSILPVIYEGLCEPSNLAWCYHQFANRIIFAFMCNFEDFQKSELSEAQWV